MNRKLLILTILFAMALAPSMAFACDEQHFSILALSNKNSDIEIDVVSPVRGSLFTEDFVQIFVTYSAENEEDLDTLDHIHYGIGILGSNVAELGEFTMPDLTGRVELFIPNPEINGTYEICAYLARADHSHLSETACTYFVLATSGILVYQPKNNAELTSSSLDIEFETYGTTVTDIEYRLDGGAAVKIPITDIKETLSGLSNGTHSIEIKAYNGEGQQLGKTVTRTVIINSKLTVENGKNVFRYIKKAKRLNSTAFLKRAMRLARQMKKGGDYAAESPDLNQKKLRQIIKSIKKAMKTGSMSGLGKTRRTLKRLIK